MPPRRCHNRPSTSWSSRVFVVDPVEAVCVAPVCSPGLGRAGRGGLYSSPGSARWDRSQEVCSSLKVDCLFLANVFCTCNADLCANPLLYKIIVFDVLGPLTGTIQRCPSAGESQNSRPCWNTLCVSPCFRMCCSIGRCLTAEQVNFPLLKKYQPYLDVAESALKSAKQWCVGAQYPALRALLCVCSAVS